MRKDNVPVYLNLKATLNSFALFSLLADVDDDKELVMIRDARMRQLKDQFAAATVSKTNEIACKSGELQAVSSGSLLSLIDKCELVVAVISSRSSRAGSVTQSRPEDSVSQLCEPYNTFFIFAGRRGPPVEPGGGLGAPGGDLIRVGSSPRVYARHSLRVYARHPSRIQSMRVCATSELNLVYACMGDIVYACMVDIVHACIRDIRVRSSPCVYARHSLCVYARHSQCAYARLISRHPRHPSHARPVHDRIRVGSSLPAGRVRSSPRVYARVCACMRVYARVCAFMRVYARVCACMRVYARLCASMRVYAFMRDIPVGSRFCVYARPVRCRQAGSAGRSSRRPTRAWGR
jgi:hypothetical protein